MGGGIAVLISQRDRLKSTFGGKDTSPDRDAYPHTDPQEARVPDKSTGTQASG
jgi:hypothetical protein